jgi:pterin-4a-carbinolamine dehydratase
MNTKLEDTEIQTRLAELSDWTIENGQLARKFGFSSYGAGVAFAVQVTLTASRLSGKPCGWLTSRTALAV